MVRYRRTSLPVMLTISGERAMLFDQRRGGIYLLNGSGAAVFQALERSTNGGIGKPDILASMATGCSQAPFIRRHSLMHMLTSTGGKLLVRRTDHGDAKAPKPATESAQESVLSPTEMGAALEGFLETLASLGFIEHRDWAA